MGISFLVQLKPLEFPPPQQSGDSTKRSKYDCVQGARVRRFFHRLGKL